jgi:NAD(P)-dependent dehydrogenase (short-subunit alcohol dehydrogenase family)
MEIKGCIALVTGGASGLGEAAVRELAGGGARVAILDLDEEGGQQTASELGEAAIFCKTDVTDERSVQEAVNKTVEAFGTVHVAVNCAGVATPAKVLGKEGPMPIERFDQVVQINLIGTMNVIRLAAQQMNENDPNEDGEKGVLINTASIAAWDGQLGQAAYSASKAGVVGMTLPIAREFGAYGLRIMTIAPGIFETPMIAGMPDKIKDALRGMSVFPKRLGIPIEFARLVRHIIENTMLNGEVIRLDGAVRMSAK